MQQIEKTLRRAHNFVDMTGQQFGDVKVIAFAGKDSKRKQATWECLCSCGKRFLANGSNLRRSHYKSCGCQQSNGDAHTIHGKSGTPEYSIYVGAKDRCTNPNTTSYRYYGAKGVEFRFNSINEFIESVGLRPGSEYTIERIDVNGHYEPGNVRWATRIEQANNKTNNVILTVDSVSATIPEWARRMNIKPATIHARVRRGWCDFCSVMLPLHDTCIHLESSI